LRLGADCGNLLAGVKNPAVAQTGEGDSMIAAARRDRIYRRLVSVFLVLTLGTQIATLGVTAVRPGWLTAKLYPIIEYPMYAPAHYEGERVTGRWLLRGVLASGGEIEITEQSLRTSIWDFILLTDPIATGTPNSPRTLTAIQRLVAVVREREPRARELKMLRIESYPLKVTRNGAEKIPSETVVSIPMPSESDIEH
jgi:hypothetical protein